MQSADRNGRGQANDWSQSRAFRPGGNLVLTGKVQYKGYPLPTLFKGQEGTIVVTFHEQAKQTVKVRVTSATVKLDAEKEDFWKITLSCEITDNPTLSGFNGDQPAATDPTKSTKELFVGLGKTRDPNALQSAATQMFDIWPLADTDAGEWQAIADVIAAASTPFTGAKVKTAALVPGRSKEAGIVSVQWSLTDTAEDVINPATALNVDPSKLQTGGTVAAINATPIVPTVAGQTTIARTTSTRELNDGAILKTTEYGQRTTAEDLTMPGTFTNRDPLGIDTQGQKTEVFATGSPPANPTPPAGLQLVSQKTEELNRDESQRVTTFDVLNSEQKRTYPRIHTVDDANNIEDSAVRAQFWTVGDTPPATPADPPVHNVKLIDFDDIPITPTRMMRVWSYGAKDSADEQILPHYNTDTDPNALESRAVRASLDGSTITDPAGLVLRNTRTLPVTLSLGVNRTLTIKEYGVRSTKDDVEYPGTKIEDDPRDLSDEQPITLVQASATPTPPTTPSGLKLARTVTEKLTAAGQWKHTFYFKRRDSEDEVEMDASSISDDPSDLADEQVISEVQGSATPTAPTLPTGLKLRKTVTRQLHDSKWQQTFYYARRTEQDDVEMGGSVTSDDPSDIADEQVIVLVQASATPTPPTTPSGLKIRRTVSKQIHGGGAGKWEHRFEYARRNQEDDIEFDHSQIDDDPQDLEDEQVITEVQGSATPSAPTTPSGLVLRKTVTQQLHASKWQHSFRYARRTTKDDVEMGGSAIVEDATDLGDEQIIVSVQSSATPSAPTTPTGLKLVETKTKQLHATRWAHTFSYARQDNKDKIEQGGTFTKLDPGAIASEGRKSEVYTTLSGAPTAPTAPSAELQIVGYTTKVLNNVKSERVTEFDVLTSTQRETFPKYRLSTDPQGIEDALTDAQIWDSTGSPPADPSAPAGQKLAKKYDLKVTPGLKLRVWEWATKDSKDDAEFPHERTATDPNDLESTQSIATLYVNASPPSAPTTPAGLKLRQSFIIPHTGYTSVKVWQYAKTDTLDDLLHPHQITSVDPSGLESEQIKAALDSAPSLDAGYVVRETETRIVNDSHNLILVKGGVQTVAQEIENRSGHGEFDALEMGRVTVATISTNAGSLETIGRATYDANRASVLFEKNEVQKLAPNKVIQKVTTIDRQFLLHGEIRGGKEARRAVYRSGRVQVWVSRIWPQGTGLYSVLIEPQSQYHATGLLGLTTRISGNTLPVYDGLIATTNSASFLGRGVATMSYLGPTFRTNLANTSPRVTEVTQWFRFDSGGCFDETGVICGLFDSDRDLSGISANAWSNASVFGWTDAALLPLADYSVFLI